MPNGNGPQWVRRACTVSIFIEEQDRSGNTLIDLLEMGVPERTFPAVGRGGINEVSLPGRAFRHTSINSFDNVHKI